MKILTTGGAVAATYGWLNDVSIPLFGVPLTVVAMAAFGTYLSASQGKPEKKDVRFYLKHLGYAFMAITSVSIIPNLFGWDWAVPRLEGPIAGALAYAARFWIPATIDAIPEIIKKVFKLKEYKDGYEEPTEEDTK